MVESDGPLTSEPLSAEWRSVEIVENVDRGREHSEERRIAENTMERCCCDTAVESRGEKMGGEWMRVEGMRSSAHPAPLFIPSDSSFAERT